MKRLVMTELNRWKLDSSRKPLILKGARQVGKTYLLKTFGAENYHQTAYFNFESSPNLSQLFEGMLDPKQIIRILSIEIDMDIQPNTTLLIFDEIQECPAALNSLKYFNELANEYHICAAGSLLGITLAKSKGFPVGKVNFLDLQPFSFQEFLYAKEELKLIDYMEAIQSSTPIPTILHEKLLLIFKDYLYTGGMPAAILEYLASHDFERVRKTQIDILNAYRLDFSKHAPTQALMKINQTWDVIPNQLAKENKKFIYSIIRKGARAQEFEIAIQWLVETGLTYKIYNSSTPKLPLSAYIHHDIFKIYLVDVGLLGALAGVSAKAIIYGDTIFQEFKGALIENYVAQELIRQSYNIYYWTSSGQAEIDFILEENDSIFPLEVKSGLTGRKKSLSVYSEKYQPKLKIRISPNNLKLDGNTLNIPLYLLSQIKRLLK